MAKSKPFAVSEYLKEDYDTLGVQRQLNQNAQNTLLKYFLQNSIKHTRRTVNGKTV